MVLQFDPFLLLFCYNLYVTLFMIHILHATFLVQQSWCNILDATFCMHHSSCNILDATFMMLHSWCNKYPLNKCCIVWTKYLVLYAESIMKNICIEFWKYFGPWFPGIWREVGFNVWRASFSLLLKDFFGRANIIIQTTFYANLSTVLFTINLNLC